MEEKESSGAGFLPIFATTIGAPNQIIDVQKFMNLNQYTNKIYPNEDARPPQIFKEINDKDIKYVGYDAVDKDQGSEHWHVKDVTSTADGIALKPFKDIGKGFFGVFSGFPDDNKGIKKKTVVREGYGID